MYRELAVLLCTRIWVPKVRWDDCFGLLYPSPRRSEAQSSEARSTRCRAFGATIAPSWSPRGGSVRARVVTGRGVLRGNRRFTTHWHFFQRLPNENEKSKGQAKCEEHLCSSTALFTSIYESISLLASTGHVSSLISDSSIAILTESSTALRNLPCALRRPTDGSAPNQKRGSSFFLAILKLF